MTPSIQLLAIITGIGSVIVPPVTSFIAKEHWSDQTKQLIALALSLAVSVVAIAIVEPNAYSTLFGTHFVTNLAALGGLVFTGSQAFYGLFFRHSTSETKLSAFGSKPKVRPPATVVSSDPFVAVPIEVAP